MMHDTWIYLIKDNFTGFYKIGRSINPLDRFKSLCKQDTKLPMPNDFLFVEAWRATSATETHLHRELRQVRKRGEWFELSDYHLGFIKQVFHTSLKLSTMSSDLEDYLDYKTQIEESWIDKDWNGEYEPDHAEYPQL